MRRTSGDPVVKNPPCNVGDVALIPGQETKIPHATKQLNLRLQLLSMCAPELCTTARVCVASMMPHTATKTQCSQIHSFKTIMRYYLRLVRMNIIKKSATTDAEEAV